MSHISTVAQKLSRSFLKGSSKPIAWRKNQLTSLRKMITENEEKFQEACFKDLGKSKGETWLTETQGSVKAIDGMLASLDKWVKPKHVETDVMNFPATSMIKPEPLGPSLVVACWNYPILLLVEPLAAAISAGNTVCVKTASEAHSPETMKLFTELFPKYLDNDCIDIIDGGEQELNQVLKHKWEVIFATGSPGLGRVIAKAAVPNLTRCILELGGKSPTYVDDKCNIKIASNRIVWGSLALNSGMTCIRPDHLFVKDSVGDEFIQSCKDNITKLFGKTAEEVQANKNFGRMPKVASYLDRMESILKEDAKYIVHGGHIDKENCFVEPTILDFGTDSEAFHKSASMRDEIFGPILPILRVKDPQEAVDSIMTREKPLALYAFSDDKNVQEMFINLPSGNTEINDNIMFMMNKNLPFGGVGNSGSGKYHGVEGFNSFSHHKTVLINTNLNELPLRYQPSKPIYHFMLGLVNRHIPAPVITALNNIPAILAVIAGGIAYSFS